MAITIIALTGAMMLPPLFVASATRVQNRRAEQALQLAQGEVDRIRALVEQNAQNASNLPAVATVSGGLSSVAAPTGVAANTRSITGTTATCNQAPGLPTVNQVLKIDLDSDADCDPEFVMQVFRSDNSTSQFEVGVRVYSASALATNGTTLQAGLATDEASLRHTTATGNQQRKPLAVLYTDIHATNFSQSMCNFQAHETCTP
ncbi:MAG: hypothetical protein F6K09_17145 [Merismopedia sp. SIO2A8]|nr:hypothetical protein [Merismopedia sp. SIO2A8]